MIDKETARQWYLNGFQDAETTDTQPVSLDQTMKDASTFFEILWDGKKDEYGSPESKAEWYAVPPYSKTGMWQIYNDKGEYVASFETKEDCLKTVNAVTKNQNQ